MLDQDLDRRGVDGAQNAERADGEIVDLAGARIDRDRLAPHQAQAHVGGTSAVGAQRGLVERLARPHPNMDCAVIGDRRRRLAPVRPRDPANVAAGGSKQHSSFEPAGAADIGRRGRADHIDLFDRDIRRNRRDRCGNAWGAGDAKETGSVGVHPAGDRGAFRSLTDDVFSRQQQPHRAAVLVGEALCDATQRGVELAAEGATVAEQGRWSTSRLAPGRVSLEIGGLGPRRLQHSIEVTLGQFDRGRILGGCPTSLDFAGRSKRLGSGFGDRPAVSVGDRNERIRWRDVVAEAAFAEGDMGTDRLGDTALDFGAGCGRAGISEVHRRPVPLPCIEDRLPSGTSAHVGEEGVSRLGPIVRRDLLGPKSFESTDDAGGAEAALTAAGRSERVTPGSPDIGGQPLHGRHRTGSHSTDRGHARHTRLSVDQHGATTALTLGGAAVLHRGGTDLTPEDVQQGRGLVLNDNDLAVDDDLDTAFTSGGHGQER